jgi:hypothetical protein
MLCSFAPGAAAPLLAGLAWTKPHDEIKTKAVIKTSFDIWEFNVVNMVWLNCISDFKRSGLM